MDPLKPLPPLEPLPALARRRRRRLLSWATVVALLMAFAAGAFHAFGAKVFERAWAFFNVS